MNKIAKDQQIANLEEELIKLLEVNFSGFYCKIVVNRHRPNSYFVQFKSVGQAGFVRMQLDGKYFSQQRVMVKVAFVCPPELEDVLDWKKQGVINAQSQFQ